MKAKLVFLVLYATLLTSVECIKVPVETDENSTTTVQPPDDVENESVKNTTEIETENDSKEARTIDDKDDKLPDYPLTTPTDVHKIPPTLQNVKKVEPAVKEKPEKSLKDFASPTPAPIHNHNSLPDARLKQAIINSKQQSLKNLIDKNGKLKDQIARPNEVQADIAVETPLRSTSTKDFVPSPELSPLYTANNHIQDHFHPVNQYYRPPTKQDVHFPHDSSHPSHLDTKWLGSSRSPTDSPNDISPSQFMQQHGRTRNTQIDYPLRHHHVDRDVHYNDFNNHHFHHGHYNSHFNQHISENTGERMVFPSEASPFSDEITPPSSLPPWPQKIPELNKHEKMKGSWKWVPEGDDETETIPPETKFPGFNVHSSFFESHKPPHTVHDRPYAFESSEIFSHHTTPPTGPGSSSHGGTAEALTSNGHNKESEDSEDIEKVKTEVKILRPPSPWKRFFHVMTAAIPIGIIISALTPRFVYIHPNATTPTLQPPFFNQLPFQPPPQFGPSSPQQPPNFQQPGQNQPQSLRQRAYTATDYPQPDPNQSLADFMKFVESSYREKHGITNDTCEDKFFCELALLGADENAELMHRTLYKVAIETPRVQAEKSGLYDIFTAIKRHNCEVFNCKRT